MMNNQFQEKTHQIVEAARIVSLLKRLMKEQVPITVRNDDTEKEWHGTIGEMLFHQGELILNEIENVGSQETCLNEGINNFHGKITGVVISFKSSVVNIEKTSKKTICRITYPTIVTYHQRRSAERVGIWVDQKIPVCIHLDGDAQLKGHVRDISIDGLNACFYRVIPIAPNELLPVCTIQLPNDKTIESKLEVRGITVNENNSQLHLRGKFLELARESREELTQFVKGLELSLGEPD